ncbi:MULTISPECIES: 1,6-anhydro-N-acetylmuramyl-L-alanine amidase AmpD [unclassified Pseudoalteromonas]|uniref:1,6-anhydro-N-acetylmuramyl-L-alanine amidase AmpD n=1 Tax=unclassified Pseudoalteromonas TaxID=194690 RepID=UPI002097B8D9|nr:1,6-anhydro-N-acetylmuramyl-L-alanine amidase AmpD [Pseudoalteromonas sp. XMcav2-N]MCO7188773.1 1,6-anhydro-N-acetylmuramyl-L-alanine amidase AmpD [Pseudoalteromonas sp. XMcav2-N]
MQLNWLCGALQRHSPHYNERPAACQPSLLVIHCISLPEGEYGGDHIDNLFMGTLDCQAHPSFESLRGVRVSAHCVIRRDGTVVQYVPFDKRAWHAGVSEFAGQENCNDFSIGVELEGTDTSAYTEAQYQALAKLTVWLQQRLPELTKERIVGHSDIAPGRKSDPGVAFDWDKYFALIT